MSTREDFTNQLADKIRKIREWAPYGVITGFTEDHRARCITFGLPRTLDASVDVYSETYLVLRTSQRPGPTLFKSEQELLDHLTKTFT